jgi:SWI/SNF-related matrix-associated actin-dependent regulator 1 of chromatin subfamily A
VHVPSEFYEHQRRALSWLSTRPRSILALQQGLGKTAVAIADAVYPVAVVPPAHGNITWRDEWKRWAPDRNVQIVRPKDHFDLDADVWVLNYDIIRRTSFPARVQTLIADESQYLVNREATRTRRFAKIAQSAPRLRLLSGTPMQRPIDLWTQLRMVGGTRMSYEDFGRWFCAGFLDEHNQWNFRGASHQDALRDLLARSMFRVTKEEALPDMPPKVWKVVPLDLPAGNERDYDLAAIERLGIPTPFEGLSELLRLQSEIKLPYVIRYLEDALKSEDKILVFAWHRDMVRAIAQHFASVGVITYNGETPRAKKETAEADFQTGDARLFVGNIVSAGSVLTLTRASFVVFAEGSWNPNQLDQAADRVHRIGQTRPVRIRILTINGSIDHHMVRRCLEKLEVIDHVVISTKGDTTACPNNPFQVTWPSPRPSRNSLRL